MRIAGAAGADLRRAALAVPELRRDLQHQRDLPRRDPVGDLGRPVGRLWRLRMPLYEYSCRDCGRRFEVLQRMGAGAAGLTCPQCGSENVGKQFSTFASAGGGGTLSGGSGGASCGGSGFS